MRAAALSVPSRASFVAIVCAQLAHAVVVGYVITVLIKIHSPEKTRAGESNAAEWLIRVLFFRLFGDVKKEVRLGGGDCCSRVRCRDGESVSSSSSLAPWPPPSSLGSELLAA